MLRDAPLLDPTNRAPTPDARASTRVGTFARLPSLRVQLLVALGLLTLASFVPLFLAVASLTRVTLHAVREDSARVLGRAVAGRLIEVARNDREGRALADVAAVSVEPWRPEGDARSRGEGVIAVRVVRSDGVVIEHGATPAIAALRASAQTVSPGESTRTLDAGPMGAILAIDAASTGVRVQVALRSGEQASRAAPLLRLVAFYTAGFAIVLLSLAALLVTRLVVRPLGTLVEATRDIEHGARRRLDARALRASESAREIAELAAAIDTATAQLVDREEALARKVAQLEAARAELISARDAIVRTERLASVGRLSAGLAHEVGNPLAALMGLADVLAMGELDEDARDLVARIKRETERVHRIIRDLLDFSRAESPVSASDEVSPADVAEVVAETLALVRPQRSFRDVSIATHLAPSLPPVRIAPGRLQQVLLNLVLNAADAIGEKAARDAADGRTGADGEPIGHVAIDARRDGEHEVLIRVRDDGPGVPPAVRAAIFEPFVTSKEIGKGTGLGLAVCRGLVEAAGGSITLLDDAPGAHFALRLPTADAPTRGRPTSIAPPASRAS
jgi:two-component system NtrC family sensor kinase